MCARLTDRAPTCAASQRRLSHLVLLMRCGNAILCSRQVFLAELGGVLVASRTAEARTAKPDRLDLDRRQLRVSSILASHSVVLNARASP